FRRKVRDWIGFSAALSAIRDKRYDDARRYALDVSATDQRAYLLFEIARAALEQKDRQRATELLDEAARKAAAADNAADKLRTLALAQSLDSKPLKLAAIVAVGASVFEKSK